MGHQLFEKYIFNNKTLSSEENQLLQEHISECDQCAKLYFAWQQVENELQIKEMVSPAAGFVSRWHDYVVTRRAIQHRSQAIKTFLIVSSVILMLTGLLAIWLLLNYSLSELIVQGVSLFSNLVQVFFNFRAMTVSFLRSAPPFITPLIWIFIAGWSALLASFWGLTVWRITRQGVSNR